MKLFKNFVTKSIFIFALINFAGLSAMVEKAKTQTKTTQSAQTVFGHRLRLKNFTRDRLFVEVESHDGEVWGALVEIFNSIDIGSIHDKFKRIIIST